MIEDTKPPKGLGIVDKAGKVGANQPVEDHIKPQPTSLSRNDRRGY